MKEKELQKVCGDVESIFRGILFHNQQFAQGREERIFYNFSCPEYEVLKEKYGIEAIAGKGSDFSRAKRLLHYLAPRLSHSPFYDGHVPGNAVDLLDYSLNNPEQGINCKYKSKILEECCLALGIYARRVFIMPYSPYDWDNHVVTEIFDRKKKKWIMLDPTTDGYFVDEGGRPLSLAELRECFAKNQFATFVPATSRLKNLDKCREKYAYYNCYICKNLFYFILDQDSTAGETNRYLYLCPENFSILANDIANIEFRLKQCPEDDREMREKMEGWIAKKQKSQEPEKVSLTTMTRSPV